MAGPAPGSLTAAAPPGRDPASLVPALRSLLARAAALPDAALTLRDFAVAGMTLRARFTDAGLARTYGERLAFPAAPLAKPDLYIDVLEAVALGWPDPPAWPDGACSPLELEAALARAGLRGLHSAEPAPGLWSLFAPAAGRALQFAAAVERLPAWDAGAPLRLALHWAAAERGGHLVHAATLGSKGGAGVLIVGQGGAGKSGTTLAGIAAGLATVGDDYVILRDGAPPVAYPAYRLLKQDWRGIARFPGLGERLAGRPPNWQGKIEFDPAALFPGCLVPALPLRAILLARIDGVARTRITPIAPGIAFRAFVPSALNQLGTGTVAGFQFFSRLLRTLPTFALSLSGDPGDIADALRDFLERPAA